MSALFSVTAFFYNGNAAGNDNADDPYGRAGIFSFLSAKHINFHIITDQRIIAAGCRCNQIDTCSTDHHTSDDSAGKSDQFLQTFTISAPCEIKT